MKAFVLFRTDPWHYRGSRELMGVFTSSYKNCERVLREDGATEEQIWECLYSGQNQSQCSEADYEYERVNIELNRAIL